MNLSQLGWSQTSLDGIERSPCEPVGLFNRPPFFASSVERAQALKVSSKDANADVGPGRSGCHICYNEVKEEDKADMGEIPCTRTHDPDLKYHLSCLQRQQAEYGNCPFCKAKIEREHLNGQNSGGFHGGVSG